MVGQACKFDESDDRRYLPRILRVARDKQSLMNLWMHTIGARGGYLWRESACTWNVVQGAQLFAAEAQHRPIVLLKMKIEAYCEDFDLWLSAVTGGGILPESERDRVEMVPGPENLVRGNDALGFDGADCSVAHGRVAVCAAHQGRGAALGMVPRCSVARRKGISHDS